jgi:hypothetical protein
LRSNPTGESNEQWLSIFILRGGWGSVYDQAIGSDSFSEPGWYFNIDGDARRGADLWLLEDAVIEYLNLGAHITVR